MQTTRWERAVVRVQIFLQQAGLMKTITPVPNRQVYLPLYDHDGAILPDQTAAETPGPVPIGALLGTIMQQIDERAARRIGLPSHQDLGRSRR
jgi:hypothetical protein